MTNRLKQKEAPAVFPPRMRSCEWDVNLCYLLFWIVFHAQCSFHSHIKRKQYMVQGLKHPIQLWDSNLSCKDMVHLSGSRQFLLSVQKSKKSNDCDKLQLTAALSEQCLPTLILLCVQYQVNCTRLKDYLRLFVYCMYVWVGVSLACSLQLPLHQTSDSPERNFW